ncbi:MAG: hypothetical protein Q8S44_00365, partial [Flavobacteriaceae bacterium]|nr:hypothetical protein [Flavobacteriaceae bacterium]
MKIAKKLSIIVILLLNLGCNDSNPSNPCGDGVVLASTGPPVFELKIVDKTTSENLITKGIYAANQITITDINGIKVEYYFRHENQSNT